jgi:peptide/nickel transport system substrate-binding protein
MFMGLLEARLENNQLKFHPSLASRWEVGADNQTFTFTIHPRANWHDGRPVTADDVLFTVMTISDPKTETNRGNSIALIAGLDEKGKRGASAQLSFRILGPKQFEVKTKAPVDPLGFLEHFGTLIYILPKHVLGNVPPEQLSRHPFFQEPKVGSGPYKVVKLSPGAELLLKAWGEHWREGVPKYKQVRYLIVPEESTRIAFLSTKQADTADVSRERVKSL